VKVAEYRSWFCFEHSLRRPLLGLSDRFSCSSENGSPKRGRDETCACYVWILVQTRSCVFERTRVPLKWEGLV